MSLTIAAPITEVTVLEDRASITRRGTVQLPAGQSRIVIEGVSPVLADKTLTATASKAKLLDVRCERHVVPWSDRDGTIAKLEVERARLATEVETIAARVDAARAEAASVGQLVGAGLRDLAIAASRGIGVPSAAAELAELDALDAASRARIVDTELAASDGALALERIDARIARAKEHEAEEVARLVIDLVAEEPAEVTLAIGYIAPGAAWRPYHRAVLARADAKVEWQTTACVWQSTGEDWSDATLTCSLERPSLGVEPPTFGDDELRARRRPETVIVESRDQQHQTSGLGSGPAQVPGIDDGGLGLTLTAAKATVRSDGRPHRIDVASFSAPVQLSFVAIPLRSPWVHLRARIVNTGTTPLLAGPIDLIMSSGYIGRAEIGFVATGEQFHVGFGPESDVRVHRTETRDQDETGLLGGNLHTTRIAVRLSNLGAERREIVVTERVPISEVEQVEIQVGAPDAYLLAADDHGREGGAQVTARAIDKRGLVTWTVDLPPYGRRAVTLEYRVKSQRGVAGV